MSANNLIKSSTPVSTVSSSGTNNALATVQSGPYTKAQFQNTMEGSRSVKNITEIEQLLRDYPAALDLFRTGRYKVKVKYDADVERVILVEKRISKDALNGVTKTNDFQQTNQLISDTSTNLERTNESTKRERHSDRSRSRTHSRDRVAPTIPVTDNDNLVQTTTASNYTSNKTQSKVDHHRTASKENDISMTSQSKHRQRHSHHRDHSRDSPSYISRSKQKGKKYNRDYPKTVVPYVPNGNSAGDMWQRSRALQPYYSNPILQQTQQSNMYMPPTFVPQQNPIYQQPYHYGQQPPPGLVYQTQSAHPKSTKIRSAGNITKPTIHSAYDYPSSSWTTNNSNHGANIPPNFHTSHPNQQQYPPPHSMYHSQIPFQQPGVWSQTTKKSSGPNVNNDVYVNNRRNVKHRAHSIDTLPNDQPSAHYHNQQQQQQPASMAVEHHHHHRHHRHRSHPTNVQPNGINPSAEIVKEQNIPLKGTTTVTNNVSNDEKLTIRQLNDIFVQTDPSGRLPYNMVPSVLQRFGILLTENDLISAAQELKYNTAEPISARRLVHILIKVGKIARSSQLQKQQRLIASPTMLPEDREVTDIMTQRRVTTAPSTHIHSSTHPNYWY